MRGDVCSCCTSIAEFARNSDGFAASPSCEKLRPGGGALNCRPVEAQWPKNSHSRMITGIGTPSIHNNNPRPMSSSSILLSGVAGVRHRGPGLLRRLRIALLEQFDRVQIRRPDEGHVAVARRPVDGDAGLHQLLAGGVDVVDLLGEMAEEAVLAVLLLVPVPGELDQWRAAGRRLTLQRIEVVGRAQEHQREPPLLVLDPSYLLQTERIDIEFQRDVEIAHAQHG
ncbi:hypothetical protein E4T56_gene8893, partial [Termitomyces sp. T112]